MTHPMYLTLEAPIEDNTAVTTAQTLAAADYMDIDGSVATDGVATLAAPARLNIVAADTTGVTFTVTGTTPTGMPLTENIAGGTGTVMGEQTFATVTSIYADGAITNTSVGGADTASTQWVPLNTYMADFQVSFYGLLLTDGITWSVDVTFDDIYGTWRPADIPFPRPITPSATSDLTGGSNGVINDSLGPVTGIRATIVNGDGLTGSLSFTVIQQGY